MDIEEILRREKEETRAVIKEMVERLSFSLRIENDGLEKLRVRKALRILKNRGEIIDFLEDRKPYRDFVVIFNSEVKRRYEHFSLKVVRTRREAQGFQNREKRIRRKIRKRKFIAPILVIVNGRIRNVQVIRKIRKIVEEKKKS